MPILSGGTFLLGGSSAPTTDSTIYYPSGSLALTNLQASHAEIYRKQIWVYTVVRKLATATARLPLKVYERMPDGSRVAAPLSPYSRLLANPNPQMDSFYFWLWTASTMEVYGEAIWAKVRDRRGVVTQLWPLHPTSIYTRRENGALLYGYMGQQGNPEFEMPARDVVHFKSYNPSDTVRGMSPLEPLRQTLLNEDASRRATSAFWQNGARPSVALKHPGNLSQPAAERLKARWEAIASGADNTGKTVVLEEGMEAQVLSLSAEEAQYIETRKLNREEVCGAYDVPPPVVHILDHATYSNITEQMRSMYRDTMAPRLSLLESVLDAQLRPDFAADRTFYAEFLLDEVLRGDFEVRLDAMGKALQTGQLTVNEARAMENRPAVEGGDVPLINSAMVPLPVPTEGGATPAQMFAYDLEYGVVTVNDRRVQLGLPPIPDGDVPPTLPAVAQAIALAELPVEDARSVTDRAARRKSLADIDRDALVAGLDGSAAAVLSHLDAAQARGASVPEFCASLWQSVRPPDPAADVAKAIREMAPPVVNVTVESPTVNIPPAPARVVKTIDRDSNGDMTRIVEES